VHVCSDRKQRRIVAKLAACLWSPTSVKLGVADRTYYMLVRAKLHIDWCIVQPPRVEKSNPEFHSIFKQGVALTGRNTTGPPGIQL